MKHQFVKKVITLGVIIPGLAVSTLGSSGFLFLQPLVANAAGPTCAVPGDYSTIQAAVNDAGCTTINVAAGTYIEHVAVNRAVTLNGVNVGVAGNSGSRVAESIVDGSDTGTPFAITANGVTIDGFTVKGGSNGGLFSGIWSQTGTQNSTIQNNIIMQNGFGVWAQCGGNCLIQNNLFDGNNKSNSPGSGAISADSTTGLTINNNEFKNDSVGNPILLQAVAPGAHNGIVISNNNFHGNTNASVIYALAITGGTFNNNTIAAASDVTGISFSGADQNITVTGNSISGAARGIRVEDAGFYPSAGANSNVAINRNSIAGNSEYGVGNVTASTASVNATCNWWGAASGPGPTGPGTGDKVDSTSPVDISTWLGTSDLNGPCGNSFPPPTGSIVITKYACPDGTAVTRTANGVGQAVPAGCTLQSGATFGYVHGTQTDANAPFPELSASLTAGGATNGSGVLTIPSLPADGRYLVVETNASNQQLAAGDILGLYCQGDGDTSGTNDNQELTFVSANQTVSCVAYDKAVVPPPTSVSVHIFKYVDGVSAASNGTTSTFPMVTTFNSTNIGSATDAAFTLSPTGWGGGDAPYEASFNNSDPGASYSTHEVTGGGVVGDSCSTGQPFALDGYSTGATLSAAESAPKSLTVPNFPNLTSDEYVIVWNKPCPVVQPTFVKVHILKYLDGAEATAVSANNYLFPMNATWTAANLNGGVQASGNYTLGNNFGGAADLYGADTAAMAAPADYATNEMTTDLDPTSKVLPADASCIAGDYQLVGYKSSLTSLADALAQPSTTLTPPSFVGLSADAYVVVYDNTCATTGTLTFTKDTLGGDDGTFTFTGSGPIGTFTLTTVGGVANKTFTLAPGKYTITEAPKAGWTQMDSNCTADTVSEVTAGGSALCAITNSKNSKLGEIRGSKIEDKDGDGTLKDGDHHRLAGWTIYIDKNNNNILDAGDVSTVTDSHGQYSFKNLPAGTYVIREVQKTGWVSTYPSSNFTNDEWTVTLGAGKVASRKNFGNFHLGTISGMKFNDLDGDGYKDHNEPGLAGWTIQLSKGGVVIATAVTDANGNYYFPNLGPGKYKVTEVQQAGWYQMTDNPKSIKITSGATFKDNFGNHYGKVKHGHKGGYDHDW